MQFSRALRVLSQPRVNSIAFVGAGGKTTSMFHLARELQAAANLPVCVTVTTHLGARQTSLADQHITANLASDLDNYRFQGVTLITGPVGDHDRTSCVDNEVLSRLKSEAQNLGTPLLIEADGARQKLLKAPDAHEPAIPDFVEMVIVVASLAALDKPLTEEYVHRPEIVSKLSGLKIGESVTSDAIINMLTHPNGGLKNIPSQTRRVVLLTQADARELQSIGGKMASSLLTHFDAVVVGTLQRSNFQTFERTAGIILAAGASTRFGQPKQLLDWRGKPFVRAVAKTALESGLSPVVMVTGAYADQIEAAVQDLPVQMVRNSEWQSGQASSIRAGVQSLPDKTGAAIFLLADQPQIKSDIIRALIAHHSTELFPIIAPLVLMEQRANPVLFDRDTFSDLVALQGDVGGRAIFSKHHVEYLPWHDDSLLFDVDKPEDYPRMKELE